MARKVSNISSASTQPNFLLSQTPKNYDKNNFYIKELQDKVNAEWPYRPNRVDVQYEVDWGQNNYADLEVIVQQVKTDRGTDVSNDCRRFVFKDIREKRFNIGNKFKFYPFYTPEGSDYETFKVKNNKGNLDPLYVSVEKSTYPITKSIPFKVISEIQKDHQNTWLVTNFNQIKVTSSVIIERCNGTLGSVYRDAQGIAYYHYEPVIQGRDLQSVSLYYNETAVSPQSGLTVIAQHNQYTKTYHVNQRFIVGYDKVYRIKAINKFYGNTTNDPENIGLMKIYLEVTETSEYDDFKSRIAYQMEPFVHIDTRNQKQYVIRFEEPAHIEDSLGTEVVTFAPALYDSEGNKVENVPITTNCSLIGLPDGVPFNAYIDFIHLEGNKFSLQRKRIYLNGNLKVQCVIYAEDSPTGKEISSEFSLNVGGI